MCQRLALPGSVIAKLSSCNAQVANTGLHPPDDRSHAAKAGEFSRHGHAQIDRGRQFRWHAMRVTKGKGVATWGCGSTQSLLRQAQGRVAASGARGLVTHAPRRGVVGLRDLALGYPQGVPLQPDGHFDRLRAGSPKPSGRLFGQAQDGLTTNGKGGDYAQVCRAVGGGRGRFARTAPTRDGIATNGGQLEIDGCAEDGWGLRRRPYGRFGQGRRDDGGGGVVAMLGWLGWQGAPRWLGAAGSRPRTPG